MHNRVKASAQQRFDLLDFLTEGVHVSEEFAIINEQLFTKSQDGGFALKGMEINVDGGPALINATLEEICIVTSAGIMHRRLATESQLTCGTTEGMVATGTNFIEAEVFYVGDDNENRVFWDPLVDMEFTQATDTTTREDVRLISNAVGFSTGGAAQNKTRVAIVITNGGVVERIHDNYGNVVFSGAPSNPNFAENRLFRLNDLNSDGDTNRFDFGSPRTDLTINSLKEAFDALATQFKDLIGDGKLIDLNTNNWFDKMPVNMFALAQDRAVFMDGIGDRNWVAITNTLSWTSNINIRQAGFPGVAVIPAGSTTLLTANEDILYVELDRDSTITYNPTLQKTTFTNWFATHSKDKFLLAWRAADGPDDNTYWRDGVTSGTGDVDVLKALPPIGSIIPFHDYTGALTYDSTYWVPCDGNSHTVGGVSRLVADMSNRYLVGFGTEGGQDINTALFTQVPIGNASHQINLQHDHTIASHTHSLSSHTHTVGGHTHGPGNFAARAQWVSGDGLRVDRQGGLSGWSYNFVLDSIGSHAGGGGGMSEGIQVQGTSGANSSFASGAPSTNTSGGSGTLTTSTNLSTTQSIQPRSIRVRFIMRAK